MSNKFIIDYETYPISRKNIRFLAEFIRDKLHIKTTKFPVIKLLDYLEQNYDDINYSVDSDSDFEENVMAYLDESITGMYTIHIRNSVYEAACNGDKMSIGFICHEMSHYFMICWFGFKPKYGRILGEKKIEKFRSIEWQAKALCGELMIPYENFITKSIDKIMNETDSSYSQAKYYKENIVDILKK